MGKLLPLWSSKKNRASAGTSSREWVIDRGVRINSKADIEKDCSGKLFFFFIIILSTQKLSIVQTCFDHRKVLDSLSLKVSEMVTNSPAAFSHGFMSSKIYCFSFMVLLWLFMIYALTFWISLEMNLAFSWIKEVSRLRLKNCSSIWSYFWITVWKRWSSPFVLCSQIYLISEHILCSYWLIRLRFYVPAVAVSGRDADCRALFSLIICSSRLLMWDLC